MAAPRRERRPRRAVDGLLLLDKPRGVSSNAALLEVRRLFQAEKAGHTGTLDPLASGLLPICLGQTTKLSAQLLDARKRYRATVHLGIGTRTGDAEGEVIARSDPTGLILPTLQAAAARFTGTLRQRPPMHSAIKRDGLRLYELARAGVEVERDEREVQIHALRVTGFAPPLAELDVWCSKGTYIRTLAEDWAASFGQAAHLADLRRLAVGGCEPAAMHTMEQLNAAAWQGWDALDACLLPSRLLLEGWPFVTVTAAQTQDLALGRPVALPPPVNAGDVALQGEGGLLLGLGEVSAEGRLQPRRWFGGIQ